MIVTTRCPDCGSPAEIRDRAVLESTDGPIEHAKVVCVNRHWYFLPLAELPMSQGLRTRIGAGAASADRL